MSNPYIDSHWDHLIDPKWIERIDNTRLLTKCREGSVAKDELIRFTIQHYYYARNFTRYLCALMSHIEHEESRSLLAENLAEELGLGNVAEVSHAQLFRGMLRQLQIDPSHHQPFPQTTLMIHTMMQQCRENQWTGLGALCLGAEAIVPLIYGRIIEGFQKVGVSGNILGFYILHRDEDDEHALIMKTIIDRELKTHPEGIDLLRAAADRVIHQRCAMLDGVCVDESSCLWQREMT